MLIYKGQIIAGGGTIVMPMTRAEYEANKAVLDSADVWVDLTDEPDSVADGECVQYDSDLNFEDIGNIATKAIAKVEPSDTARYLHKVGEGFINKDGNYCITDVQISVGGTITLGTNCHVVDGGISSNLSSRYNMAKLLYNNASITLDGQISDSNDGWAYIDLPFSVAPTQAIVSNMMIPGIKTYSTAEILTLTTNNGIASFNIADFVNYKGSMFRSTFTLTYN